MSSSNKFYQPRHPEDSPFFKVLEANFDTFELNFPALFQPKYGFWRPVIRKSLEKFLKCGDLREGFAIVRCRDCGDEKFVAFSCKQRSCCPSCDKKRSIILGRRLTTEIILPVAHRQWVFTIPKRLRIFYRMDRRLLGKLSRCAYETMRELFRSETGNDTVLPGMFSAIQTFGDLLNWHCHIHSIVTEGAYTEDDKFIRLSYVNLRTALAIWEDKVCDMMLREEKISQEVVNQIKSQKHSGFSIDNSVRIPTGDNDGIHRLAEYIARSPLSLTRMINVDPDGSVVYRASNKSCVPYPAMGDETFKSGVKRNFQAFKPLDFLAEVTQHIPNKGEHQIRFYGRYSNKGRGYRQKKADEQAEINRLLDIRHRTEEIKARSKFKLYWAAMIRLIFEVDPLKCQKCGGDMKVVGFIDSEAKARDILKSSGLWRDRKTRPPPRTLSPPQKPGKDPPLEELPKVEDFGDYVPNYDVCEVTEWTE